MTIGEKIKIYRKERGLTQIEFSMQTGIPIATLQRYERGTSEPTMERVTSICDVIDVPLLDFLDGVQGYSFDNIDLKKAIVDEARNEEIDRLRGSIALLNVVGLEKLADYSEDLIATRKYIRNLKTSNS